MTQAKKKSLDSANPYRESYLAGVEKRAVHHAPNIISMIKALAGFVEHYGKDHDATQRKVASSYGDFGNLSSFTSKMTSLRYTFRYEHVTQSIELRRGSNSGPIVASFHNRSHYSDEIEDIFKVL
jgi:hypothetical protein